MIEKSAYTKSIDFYQHQLNLRYPICPKCNNSTLYIPIDYENPVITVKCHSCLEGYWANWNSFTKEYNSTEKYRAFNTRLRSLNKKQFKNTLVKNISKVILKTESIITRQEYVDSILNNSTSMVKLYNNDYKINQVLRMCTKSELIVLKSIIIIGNKQSVLHTVPIKGINSSLTLTLSKITSDNPLIFDITEECGLNNSHGILKNLMNKGLIAFDETENYIDIHTILLKKFDYIQELLLPNPKLLDDELTYNVYKSNNFRCTNCGESGIPLKVAFLSKKKDITTAVPICSVCYNSLVENNLITDGSLIIFDNMFRIKSWQFVKTYFPSFSEKFFKEYYLLTLKYGEENMIKAVAYTLFQMNSGKRFSKLVYMYKFIKKILDNAEKKGEPVSISELISEQYEINKWIS